MKSPQLGLLLFMLAGMVGTTNAQTPTTAEPAKEETLAAVLHADQPGPVISRNIYGQFAEHLGHCIYEGLWVGADSPIPNTRGIRNDVVAALKKLNLPVLRWPGGCFADEYHWRDGIGPSEKRPSMINTHWGGLVENNHFGTHEFFDLCEQLGTEPYICGNVGSGTVQEMMEWVEYMTSDADSPMANLRRQNGRDKPWKLTYFGVGNESWGCGGSMRPEYYADEFRRYNTFAKNYPGNKLYRIACGSNGEDYNWTEVLMKNAGKQMDGLSLHYYTLPTGDWKKKGSATDFTEEDYIATLRRTVRMDEIISKHAAIMDKFDEKKRVGLVVDEWGTWYDVEPGTNPGFLYQQNSLRDAMVAALNFNIFHRHADRVAMANVAQMINVLQAMILTDKEKMVLTPTYHVFEMYKVHQGATFLPLDLQPATPASSSALPPFLTTASRDAAGLIHVSVVNPDLHHPLTLRCQLAGATPKAVSGRILTAPTISTCNTFTVPNAVQPANYSGATIVAGMLELTLPAKSIVVLELK